MAEREVDKQTLPSCSCACCTLGHNASTQWLYQGTPNYNIRPRDQKVRECLDFQRSRATNLLLAKEEVTWGHSGTSSWGRDPCMTNLSRRSSSLICVAENKKKLVTEDISPTGIRSQHTSANGTVRVAILNSVTPKLYTSASGDHVGL